MSLPNEPLIKKFFTNKIESSRDNWYEYLITIARTFYSMNNEEYKRDKIEKKFSELSNRSSTAKRDVTNFRDEFGAYGSFLGVFHLEKESGTWYIRVSDSAQNFLCTENPNAAAFLRSQLALFQYPNGMGAVVSENGSVFVQGNVKSDTLKEIHNNIRLNPLRLICQIIVALVEKKKIALSDISLSYPLLLCMFNDDRLNQSFSPSSIELLEAYDEYTNPKFSLPKQYSDVLANFKRNFHILQKTGLFVRDSRFGLMVAQSNYSTAYECIKTISEIDVHFNAFDDLYGNTDDDKVQNIIAENRWGKYYDAGVLSPSVLINLGVETTIAPISKEYSENANTHIIDSYTPPVYKTELKTNYAMNRIVFGAPGTGKSFELENDRKAILKGGTVGYYERVTFHPDYSYSQFMGTYKPVSEGREIYYKFVPGPFMRVYVEALKNGKTNNPQPYILLIEEINRARVAAVFGDVFQLLDRDDYGVSQYEIQASEDIRKYLAEELGGEPDNYKKIMLPNNMFIWATMNSADQGVFPMDTAFKRRWNFEYLGIDANEEQVVSTVDLVAGAPETNVKWNQLRKAINEKLTREYKVNEDKLLGPFFLSGAVIATISDDDHAMANPEVFRQSFKSKVLMYLYEDAAKQYKHKLFSGCDSTKYSAVCDAFDKIGMGIFGETFKEDYYNQQEG